MQKTKKNKIKLLIIDCSALIRQTITKLLSDSLFVQVIGTAYDPFNAVEKIQLLKPDIILLDIHMPGMDGLTFLQKLIKIHPIPVIIFSSHASQNSYNAIKALEIGAIEIIEKPKFTTYSELSKYKNRLEEAIITAYKSKYNLNKDFSDFYLTKEKSNTQPFTLASHIDPYNFVIAIGASTGGTEAIKIILENMPTYFPPIVITQHMPVNFTKSFANRLDGISSLIVKEAYDNEPLRPGFAYIAKGDRHLTIINRNKKFFLRLLDTPPINKHKPSVDVLFHSVAENFGKNAIGIILTGMGNDGAQGLKMMKDKGAYTIAQNEDTCIVFGMPRVAIELKAVDKILPVYEITSHLKQLLGSQNKK